MKSEFTGSVHRRVWSNYVIHTAVDNMGDTEVSEKCLFSLNDSVWSRYSLTGAHIFLDCLLCLGPGGVLEPAYVGHETCLLASLASSMFSDIMLEA